ncbi:lysM domain receptor-like kinase 3 [Senna tora]|uniref:LysM domain receptor-like kinase 3 n=1 Tax=Senna tora TaxID=362788 RepID=A0A834WDR1_9FABA|nr:lysM domain receptor-like kinase 3 [Senna tora]
MSPEFQSTGVAMQKSDVYTFGEEPLNEGHRGWHNGLRRWLDRRLKDSFPIEVAEKAMEEIGKGKRRK